MTHLNLIDFFDKGVAVDGGRKFLVEANNSRTFREVQETTYRIARALATRGIKPGTKVAVLSLNSAVAFEAVLGIVRAGCVWVTLNARYLVKDHIHVVNLNEVEAVFFAPELDSIMQAIRDACPSVRTVLSLGAATKDASSYADFISSVSGEPIEVRRELCDPVVILASGGTTGSPKGVVQSHRVWQTMVFGMGSLYKHKHPVLLMVAPMTHASGVIAMGMMHMGSTNVVLPGFDPAAVMKAIEAHRITHLFLPPTAIYMLLSHPDVRKYDYSSLSHLISASAPITADRMAEAIEVFGPVMCQMYGQTETMTTVTYHDPADVARAAADPSLRKRLTSVGKPTLVSRIGIADDEGKLLPTGSVGEIVVRSDGVFDGYYANPVETEATRINGWHRTSDMGYLDDEGYLFIVDRKRDMIISGGFNVFPGEIEQVLWSHESVASCAVIGLPDEKWGEAVTAVLLPKPGRTIDPVVIREYCAKHLASMKLPKAFIVTDDMPMTAVGKISKKVLRDRYANQSS